MLFCEKSISLFLFIVSFSAFSQQNPYVLVLGTAQDGGYPQAGCRKECCRAVWEHRLAHQAVSCIALIDPQSNQQWIFDATPDFAEQLETLAKTTNNSKLDGIFLTHAHIGHYTGLMHLGREAMGTKNVNVFAMPKMKNYLETNGPWSQLVSLQNIAIEALNDNAARQLNDRIKIQPFRVPHRDEFSETVGYQIITNKKKLVFIPDIDKWQKWNQDLREVVKANDFVLIDGTFYKDGEIARPMSEVPHPFVVESMELLKNLSSIDKKKVFFIHLNHTNPALNTKSEAHKEIISKGFDVVKQGQKFEL